MARPLPLALSLLVAATPAWAQSNSAIHASAWRTTEARPAPVRPGYRGSGDDQYASAGVDWQMMTQTSIAPRTAVGFGMFGMKVERSLLAPVTAREVAAPRSRRAGIGIRLKF